MSIASIEEVLQALKRGEMIILVDDEARENEGDLCMAAECVTAEAVNFMAKHGRGLICLTLTEERLEQLGIPMMVQDNTSRLGTAFTVSIEAKTGVTTGISAADRARTIQVAVDDDSKPADLVSPGHIFPLAARAGGTLVRTGQTEGSVDLTRMAGFKSAAVICEIMNDDGTMARMPDLEVFAAQHGLLIATVADIIQFRLNQEALILKVASNPCPTNLHQGFVAHVFRSYLDGSEHLALVLGEIRGDEPVLVRVQSQCTVGDVFGAVGVDDGDQLRNAMRQIADAGKGVLLYVGRPDRPLSWEVENLLSAKALEPTPSTQDEAINRPAPELRLFGIGAQCLREVGVRQMRLLTNNPRKMVGLEAYGLEIVERVAIEIPETDQNAQYLQKKRELDHMLSAPPQH
ncbi:MAG: 3,4-dihydroxy-2-butanone-4-phosphate synthase [Deltaproteobacteria bacterium CG_4_9_14_3_um_filter_63_12]|nr:MAG: 3,4-dihydroxy-2-butanone-4-phosphate synthase [Deltaproteobacteria bacterium CG17_big_fil_post_rev_8_21_14_2_50_63_7]PJB46790.1 MAG: 3,4-dihydroxy-2-butanone-4-phosphate synthase [Deltaproteobacteria bacterium CG_4_9_14_3_um_filter_63_12]